MATVPQESVSMLAMRGATVLAEVTAAGCTPRTRFQIASLSKQFTASAVLLLAQRGALELANPIGRWIGGGPPSWSAITLHHLLSHTSGLGHWEDHPLVDPGRRYDPDELVAMFHRVPPLFAPGTGWHYSSPGYVLLAQVAQRAADGPYHEVLADLVCTPLGMSDTFAGSPGDRHDVADGHDSAGGPVPSWELDVTNMGTGDVWSTTGDLLTWIDGLRSGRLLDARHLDLMLTEQAPTGGRPEARGYGYGWFVGRRGGRRWFQHSGDNPGFRAFDACIPDADWRVAVLSNSAVLSSAMLDDLLGTVLPEAGGSA
ncbi:serine hydrolase domain-containing protein [Micromonospora sp. NPDC092111]|uniref:serine hydrolase domain-containing protein n=1 Tax=Micromonospora sp. NPDC092111 TaxID=3364289 RepID=UPI0037FB6DCF